MSHLHRRTTAFHNENKLPCRVRSEGRMKTYDSTTDSRAWSNVVEERRQHIVEYLSGDKINSSTGQFIPACCLIEGILASTNERLKCLKKKAEYMEKIVLLYSRLHLTPEQEEELLKIKNSFQIYTELEGKVKEEKTDPDQREMFKIFEADCMEANTEISNHISTTSSGSVELSNSNVSCATVFENVTQKIIIEGVVTLSKQIAPKIIPKGYFAGTDITLPELKSTYEVQTDGQDFAQIADTIKSISELKFEESEDKKDHILINEITSKIEQQEVVLDNADLEVKLSRSELLENKTLISYEKGDSIMIQTEEQLKILKDQLSQTEQQIQTDVNLKDKTSLSAQTIEVTENVQHETAQTADFRKLIRCTRSTSCPCFQPNKILMMRTTSTNQIRIVSNKNYLKLLCYPLDKITQRAALKCANEQEHRDTTNSIDVNQIYKETNFSNQQDQKNNFYQITFAILDHGLDNSSLLIHKTTEIVALKDALEAKESYCLEQRKHDTVALEKLENIKNVVEECDDLKKKLERSQEELNQLKKDNEFIKPILILHDQASETEKETDSLSIYNLTPKAKTQIITRDIQIKKKFSDQLAVAHKENLVLKEKLSNFEYLFGKLGIRDFSNIYIEELQTKLQCLKETTRERDNLKNKVELLETQLSSYNYVLEDVEVFKQRSLLLDEVLHDRDRLSKRVEQLRGLDEEVINLRKKAVRVDQLEDDLRNILKDKKIVEEEVDRLRGKCSITEIQVLTQKAEGDELHSKLVCMEHEIENLKGVSLEKQRLIEERDHLKQNLDELVRMQGEFEHMKKQMKCLEILKAERDMFKSKYENLIGLECECDILRTQVEKGKIIEKERETLENQVDDLQTCIFEQEAEIRRLVGHIDTLAKGRDEQQEKLQEVITNMRAELEQKDTLIVSAEEKLATLQKELGNSINGLSTETVDLKVQNEKLDKLLEKYQIENTELNENITVLLRNNENLTIQIKDIMNENNFLLTKVEEKENSLNTLKEVLHDHEYILDEFQKLQFHSRDASRDMETETDELNLITTVARQQSITVQDKLTKISKLAGDNHFQELLLQSKQAVQKIANELEKQYKDWDCFKTKLSSHGKNNDPGRFCSCNKDMYIGYCFTNETGIHNKCQRRKCMRALRKRKLSRFYNQEIKDCGKQDNSTGIEKPYSVHIQTDIPGKSMPYNKVCSTEVEYDDQREIPADDDSCVKSKKIQTSDDVSTFIGYSLDKLFENNENEPKDNQKEEEAEAFESARSLDCALCKTLGERLQVLEKELSTTNDTLIQLQDKLDRISAENDALRRHSAEVQEVAKDQIKNLVDFLKESKEKCSSLEKESNKLIQSNCTILFEKDQLLNDIIRLQKEKDDLQKMLGDNIIMTNENKELKDEIIKYKKIEKVLNKVKADTADNDLIKSVQVENTNLKKTITAQFKEISKLLDKIKTPSIPIIVQEHTIDQDQHVLKKHIDNLEIQLKQLEEIAETKLLSENVNITINDLIHRLETEESKAEIRESTLKNMKATDPAALLNVEIAKLKQKMCLIEQDNSQLQEVILQKNMELESQMNVFDIIKMEKQKLFSEILKLQEENVELKTTKAELLKLEMELQNNAVELKNASDKISCLLVDVSNLKEEEITYLKENQCLQNEITRLKGQLDVTLNSFKLSSLRFSELQDETAQLKQTCKQLEGNNINLKKDLENTVTSTQNVTERLNQVMNENIIIKDVNRETTLQLANARKSLTQRDSQIKILKDEVVKCESENYTLKKDLDEAINNLTKSNDEVCQLSQNFTSLYKENEKLKNDIYSSKAGEGDNNLKSLLNKLEIENIELTKTVNIGLKNLNEANNSILENKNEISKLEWKISSLETENEKLKTELQAYFRENGNRSILKQKVSQLEVNNRKLKQDIDKKYNEHEKKSHIQDDNNNLKKLPVDHGNDSDQLERKYEETIADLKKTISGLIQKTESLETDNNKFKTDSLDLENIKLKKEQNAKMIFYDACIATEDYNVNEKLIKLEAEFRKLKTDLNSALAEAKKCNDLQNIENILKNQIQSLLCEKEELKKHFEKTLQYAENRNNRVEKLKEENSKIKYKIKQLKSEIEHLKRDLKNALHNAKKFCEISKMHDESKQKLKISELENNLEKIKENFDAALIEAKSGNEIAIQLRFDNTKQKQQISELESEITKLTNIAGALKKVHNDQDENFKIIIELEKDNSALNKRLNDTEMFKSQILNENNNLKHKLQQQQIDSDKLNEAIKILTEERNQLSVILAKAKENEANVKKRMESTNSKFSQDMDPLKTSQILYEENLAVNKKLKQMENENKTLTAILQNKTSEIQTVLLEGSKDYFEKINVNDDGDVTVLQPDFSQEEKVLNNQNSDDEFNEQQKENENKKLKEILQKVKQELLETNNDRNKLKNLLLDQKRKSKDIKTKVDQVEVLINTERNQCKEEQIKKKELEAKINQLNEKLETVNRKLELKNLELIELKNKIEDLNKNELLKSNNKLSTITPDCSAQKGLSCELLIRDENTKLALLKNITALEEELAKNQKHSHQTVIAMQFAIKLEKHRLLELKEKLEKERLKNKRLLGLQSRPIYNRSSDQSDVIPKQENKMKHHHITEKNSKLRIAEHRTKHTKKREPSKVHEKLKSKTSISNDTLLKTNVSQVETEKRHNRCRSPSNTPVKDTNSLPSSPKLLSTSFVLDKSPRLFSSK